MLFRSLLALAWLAAFSAFFYSLELPHNANAPVMTRWEIWRLVPELLIDLVVPLPVSQQGPQAANLKFIRANSGWRYFPQRLDLLLVAGGILAGAWGLGHLGLRAMRLPLPRRCLERTVFAFATGLSGLSLLALLLGCAGWLSRPLFVGVIGFGILGELCLRWRDARAPGANAFNPPATPRRERIGWWWVLPAVPFLLCMLLGSLLPSTDFDVNEYHFEGPKEYFQAGRISFLPHNVYTSFPFCTEMLTLLAMVLRQDWYRGAQAGSAVLMCFGPLTALALYAAGRRWFGAPTGLMAALIYLSTPWVYRVSIIAYAEGGLCFYLFVALFATVLAIEHLWKGAQSFAATGTGSAVRPMLLAGFLAGSAMACKYPALLSVVIPLFFAVIVAACRRPRPTGSASTETNRLSVVQRLIAARLELLAFVLGTCVGVGPWLIKNVVETNNPVYPLLYSVFGGRDWNDDLNQKWKRGHSTRAENYNLGQFGADCVEVTAKSTWLSPLLFGLAPLAFLRRDARSSVGYLWLYVGYLFLTWWFFTHRIDRFWVPMIPVVALLAGVGATWMPTAARSSSRTPGRVWRWGSGVILSLAIVYNLAFVASPLSGYNEYLFDLRHAREIATNLTAPEIGYLNQHLPPGSKVLCVGEAEVFVAEFPLVYNTVFDKSIFEEWCGQPERGVPAGKWKLRDAEEIRKTLHDAGITHVMVNWLELLRYRTTYGYTDFVSPERFAALQRLGILGTPWEIPTGYQDFARLDPNLRREASKWAPELVTGFQGQPALITFQVFPVK